MNSLDARPRTALGSSNIPRSTPLGRKKAFDGVLKAVSLRKASVSVKMLVEGDTSPKSSNSPSPTTGPTLLANALEPNNDSDSQEILYSTSSSSNDTFSSLENISLIPSSGLSEEEELQVVGRATFFEEEEEEEVSEDDHVKCTQWATPVSTHVFLPEPSKSDVRIDKLIKLAQEETDQIRASLGFSIRRKPVPSEPPSLMSTSRKALLSRLTATRPSTPSLLSFTKDTPATDRRRQYRERPWKTRNAPADSDMLRKVCVERRRLIRAGLLANTLPASLSSSPKYFLYPRAGDLNALRSEESTACLEDYYLNYVDLSFIRKTLFAFDMRMRTGSDLWADEMEEIHRYFGRDGEWEVNWDTRWKVAAWLLHQYDDDEDEEASEGDVEV